MESFATPLVFIPACALLGLMVSGISDYLDGKLTAAEMQERGIIATRQLAKRQFTWLRSWNDLHWLDSLDCDNLPRALKYLESVSILS